MNAINWKACRRSASAPDNIITPMARMSFVTLVEPRASQDGGKAKFSVSLLVPSDADLTLLKQAVKEAATGFFGNKLPPKLKDPFIKAEDCVSAKTGELYAGYEPGMIVLRPTAISRPGLVGPDGKAISEGDIAKEAYSGRWCVASLRPYGYDTNGNRGVALGLQNIQLLKHDKPLGGRVAAESEFESADEFADTAGAEGTPWD